MGANPSEHKLVHAGRPPDRGVARRQAFLQAARDVFLEQGYEAASVNDVVRRAGGSLATLYAQFGNKEGLFLAVAEDHHERAQREMQPTNVNDLPLEDGLTVIGEHSVRAMLTRENLAFYRVVVGEGRKFPQLLQRYFVAGADRLRLGVARYLEQRSALEGRPIKDPEIVAQFFIALLRSRHHYAALADPNYAVTPAQVREHVRLAVEFVLNGAARG